MKYYIDFEATEIQRKIISVGVVTEEGQEFYSLVRTDDLITPKIEEITGISQEDLDSAPDAGEVFSDLFDWCMKEGDLPEFINYGSGDFDFIYNTFPDASSLKGASILAYIYMNMYDCSEDLKKYFYVNKTISLEKLGKYFDKGLEEQTHNALDDARLLKMVYDRMKTGDRNFDAFLEYVDPKRYPDQVIKVVRLRNGEIVEEYANMKEAIAWVRSQPNYKGAKYIQNADEKIKYAAKNNSKYFDHYWRII